MLRDTNTQRDDGTGMHDEDADGHGAVFTNWPAIQSVRTATNAAQMPTWSPP